MILFGWIFKHYGSSFIHETFSLLFHFRFILFCVNTRTTNELTQASVLLYCMEEKSAKVFGLLSYLKVQQRSF